MKSKHMMVAIVMACAALLLPSQADLILTAGNFAVLGASTVTSTGNTVLNGDLGLSPGTLITGFGPGVVNGTTHVADAVAVQAQADALAAYNILAGETSIENLTGQDLGGLTLTNGVRKFNTSAQLTGILTLDAQGDSTARFDFQIGSTLTTAGSSSVLLINGALAENVFWQIGSSATLGTGTAFEGSLLANQSITLNTGSSLNGRALALNGAVTLDNNLITAIPEPVSFWLLALCAAGLGTWRRMARWQR